MTNPCIATVQTIVPGVVIETRPREGGFPKLEIISYRKGSNRDTLLVKIGNGGDLNFSEEGLRAYIDAFTEFADIMAESRRSDDLLPLVKK